MLMPLSCWRAVLASMAGPTPESMTCSLIISPLPLLILDLLPAFVKDPKPEAAAFVNAPARDRIFVNEDMFGLLW